jgi:hypothetical protein
MDKKLAVHVAAETVVLGSLTVYLINRIGALETRVAELEKDLQATAKHTVLAEKKQVEVLNAMSHLIKSNAKSGNHHTVAHQSPHDGRSHVVHSIQKKSPTPPTSDKKKVSFSDADDVEDEDSSEELVPPPKVKAKPMTRTKGIKVSPAESGSRRTSNKMDDTRAAAAALAPDDEE